MRSTRQNVVKVAGTGALAAVLSGTAPAPARAEAVVPAPELAAAAGDTAAPPPAAPPAAPYSLPWQLRPAAVVNVIRSDTSVAFYENAAGQAGSTVATTLLASYKVTPTVSPLLRLAMVQNQEPGPGLGSGVSVVNPIVGVAWAPKVGDALKVAGLAAVTVPIGMGGAKPAGMDATAAATSRGIAARSAMDNAMFAVNYFTGIVGADVAYVAHKLTLQAEVTLLELLRVRNERLAPESARTNLTAGLHAGYFFTSWLSLGTELRYQRWLSTPGFVKANAAARDTMTVALGPRFHVKMGNRWLRPGLSYSTALDKPVRDLQYHIVQADVPFLF
jgi:hypothetical protein